MSSVQADTPKSGSLLSPEKLDGKRFSDSRGQMRVLEPLPFDAKRMFWIHDVPQWSHRGGHAHRECEQIIGCFGGKCRLALQQHSVELTYHLSKDIAIYVPVGWWIRLDSFTAGSVAWVLASHEYDSDEVVTR